MNRVKTKKLLILALSVLFAFSLISFVMARPANADTSAVRMKETAEVRLEIDYDKEDVNKENPRTGLRFTGYVNDEVYQKIEKLDLNGKYEDTDVYAGIIVSKGEFSATALTHDVADVGDAPAVRWDPSKDEAGLHAFNAVLWGIPSEVYGESFTARAYWYDGTLTEGEKYTYSDNVCVRSIAEVASAELVDGNWNFTAEDLAVLESYVNGAKPVVTIGDTTLSLDENVTNEISIMQTESAKISVAPANISFKAMTETENNEFITVSGATIVANKITETAQVVEIRIGGETYVVNVNVIKWSDTDIAEGVFAAYDAKGYETTFEPVTAKPGTIAWLNPTAAKAELGVDCPEAQDGVIKWSSMTGYQTMRLYLQKPIDMTSLSHGFSIRIKTDIPNLGYNAQITLSSGTTFRAGPAMNAGTNTTTTNDRMDYTPGKWHDLMFTKDGSAKNETNITYIDLKFYVVTDTALYIDKIVDTSAWVDADMAEGVVAAYDAKSYEASFVPVGTANPGTVTWLDPAQAKTELGEDCAEAQNGVIKWTKNDYNKMRIHFQTPVDMSALGYGIVIRIKTDMVNVGTYIEFTLSDGTIARASALMGGIGGTYTPNEWYNLAITNKGSAANKTIEYVDVRFLTNTSATTNNIVYIDKIYALDVWEDIDIEEGVIAAYDEAVYTSTIVPVGTAKPGTFTYLDSTTAKTELGEDCAEAQNGVIKWSNVANYNLVRINFQTPIDMTKLDKGFSIRIKTDCSNIGYFTQIRLTTDGTLVKGLKYFDSSLADNLACNTSMGYTANEWFDLQFTKNGSAKDATNISYIELRILGGDTTTIYIDSISVIK